MAHVRKQQITFFLTSKCNLRCTYCYTLKSTGIKKEHRSLDFNFAKRGIDDFFRDYPSREIRFYGAGEPTLEFELMKQITDYARSKAEDRLKVELQTNGVFSKQIAQWVSENVNNLWISCDGPPEIQNSQRPTVGNGGTSEVVERNLHFFAKQDHMQVGVRVTVTPLGMHRQTDLIKYFHQFGIKYVNAHPSCAPATKSLDDMFTYNPIDFAQGFFTAHNNAKDMGIFYNSLFTANFDEKTRHFCRTCIPYPHLTTDGYVSSCDFAQLGPEYDPGPLQLLIYGKYIPEEDKIIYDEEKIYGLRSRNAENLAQGVCKGCEYIYNCAGGCVGQVVNETGDLMGIHKANCTITKYLAKRMPRNEGLHPVLHS